MYLLIILIVLFFCELLYLKIAEKKKIIDNPNHRSAHKNPTIRGGGIIYLPALLLFSLFFKDVAQDYLFLIISVFLVAIISFIDDINPLSTKVRILIHFLAFTLIFYCLGFFDIITFGSICVLFFTLVFSLGYLNIYNFMDGINGMTFLNALVTFVGFLIINENIIEFSNSNLIWVYILATAVFGFFNFRLKPKCFLGDVGSIAVGFTIIYFIIQLFLISKNYAVFLLLGVYLLDGGWTILERLVRRENIFEAHRRHLYQLFANEIGVSHIKISTVYFLVQLIINSIVVYLLTQSENNLWMILTLFLILSIIYFLIKKRTYLKIMNKSDKNGI